TDLLSSYRSPISSEAPANKCLALFAALLDPDNFIESHAEPQGRKDRKALASGFRFIGPFGSCFWSRRPALKIFGRIGPPGCPLAGICDQSLHLRHKVDRILFMAGPNINDASLASGPGENLAATMSAFPRSFDYDGFRRRDLEGLGIDFRLRYGEVADAFRDRMTGQHHPHLLRLAVIDIGAPGTGSIEESL